MIDYKLCGECVFVEVQAYLICKYCIVGSYKKTIYRCIRPIHEYKQTFDRMFSGIPFCFMIDKENCGLVRNYRAIWRTLSCYMTVVVNNI